MPMVQPNGKIGQKRLLLIYFKGFSLVALFLNGLAGAEVRGQQPYIPFSERLGSETDDVSATGNSSEKKKAAVRSNVMPRVRKPVASARPAVPAQVPARGTSPSSFNPSSVHQGWPIDSQAVKAAAYPPLPPAISSEMAFSINTVVPVQEPPLPSSPLPPGYVPGVTSVPVIPPETFATGERSYEGFGTRPFNSYFGKKEQEEEAEANHREGMVVPWESPPFPFSDHVGPTIGYRDTTIYPLMDAIYHGPNAEW
jgi:hypothetical protein